MSTACIDAHHHLWRYLPPGPDWMEDGMEGLRRNFLIDDLREVTSGAGVTRTIVVESARTNEETAWLCRLAAAGDLICGVVGWTSLTSPTVTPDLERLASFPKMKAVRHPIQDEPDDQFVLREDFNSGVAALKQFNLGYDILVLERHLPQTIQFVDRHPNQVFVLDHVAKPRIRDRALSPWQENIRELARRPNVYCKISGMVTEDDWHKWSNDTLYPYIETVVESFTPRRLMFGSDWPVVTLACSYKRWTDAVRFAISQLSTTEQEWILSKAAIEAYRLGPAEFEGSAS
ncbi:MAG: amidohydrolase family protein [Terracidiphilus sp.]|jgi:L-fuconolactonase